MHTTSGDFSHTDRDAPHGTESDAPQRKESATPSTGSAGAANERIRRQGRRFAAIVAATALALCAGGASACTRITPADYLKQAQSLQPLSDDIDAVAQSVATLGRQLEAGGADGNTQAEDAATRISDAAKALGDDVDASRGDSLYSRDSTASGKFEAFADAARTYAGAAASYADAAQPLAAASLTCQGAGSTLDVGDNVQFLKDYAAYLDSCSSAIDALDAADSATSADSTDSADTQDSDESGPAAARRWSGSARDFVASQRTALTALQRMGSTSDMSLDVFSAYLTKLGALSAASAPDATPALQTWSARLTELDPANSLHELESYLYRQSAR